MLRRRTTSMRHDFVGRSARGRYLGRKTVISVPHTVAAEYAQRLTTAKNRENHRGFFATRLGARDHQRKRHRSLAFVTL